MYLASFCPPSAESRLTRATKNESFGLPDASCATRPLLPVWCGVGDLIASSQ